MMVIDQLPGQIITFYSYKGGTGRSMSLANIACLLAQGSPAGAPVRGRTPARRPVLTMDWDLEAPGLHRFFAARCAEPENVRRPGVINYFYDLSALLNDTEFDDQLRSASGWRELASALPLHRYIVRDVYPGVDLIKAGCFDHPRPDERRYADLVGSFNWAHFYNQHRHALDAFRMLLAEQYDYVLIDSRTGLNDVSGICTMVLPERLVGVFTPNEQSIYGLIDLVEEALEFRQSSNDFRPLTMFPLPSRIELDEQILRNKWRNRYQEEFESLFKRGYGVEDCDLEDYFNEIVVPQRGFFAYGEKIAVVEERPDALSLRRSYETFYRRLMTRNLPWESDVREVGSEGLEDDYVPPDPEQQLRRVTEVLLRQMDGVLKAYRKKYISLRLRSHVLRSTTILMGIGWVLAGFSSLDVLSPGQRQFLVLGLPIMMILFLLLDNVLIAPGAREVLSVRLAIQKLFDEFRMELANDLTMADQGPPRERAQRQLKRLQTFSARVNKLLYSQASEWDGKIGGLQVISIAGDYESEPPRRTSGPIEDRGHERTMSYEGLAGPPGH